MSIPNVTIHLDSDADKVLLHDAAGPYPTLQIGTELTMLLDQAPTATMQAVIDQLAKAIAARAEADTAPAAAPQVEQAAEDTVRWIGVPQQRGEAAA
ncbi:hypothetical protein [Streptomyces sp. NPDC002913]